MVDTFRLMNQIRLVQFANTPFEDLAAEYQKTNNQSIIAEVFCRDFKLLFRVISEPKYNAVDKQDKVDAVLRVVYRGLEKFSPDKAVSFNTFLVAGVRRKLATYIQYLAQKKRSGTVYSLDYMKESMDNNEYEVNFDLPDSDYTKSVEFSMDMLNAGLSERQKIMCAAIMDNPKISNVELAEILKCHRHTVCAEKKILQQKLAFLV